jgi:hypothetical protein
MKVILETKCGCRREIESNSKSNTVKVHMQEPFMWFEDYLPFHINENHYRTFVDSGELTFSGLAGFEKYPLFREV